VASSQRSPRHSRAKRGSSGDCSVLPAPSSFSANFGRTCTPIRPVQPDTHMSCHRDPSSSNSLCRIPSHRSGDHYLQRGQSANLALYHRDFKAMVHAASSPRTIRIPSTVPQRLPFHLPERHHRACNGPTLNLLACVPIPRPNCRPTATNCPGREKRWAVVSATFLLRTHSPTLITLSAASLESAFPTYCKHICLHLRQVDRPSIQF